MNTRDTNRFPTFVQRYGLLVSGGIALLLGAGVFAATHNVVLAIACAAPVGVTLGVAFGEHVNSQPVDPKRKAKLALALLVGVTALIAFVVLAG